MEVYLRDKSGDIFKSDLSDVDILDENELDDVDLQVELIVSWWIYRSLKRLRGSAPARNICGEITPPRRQEEQGCSWCQH